MNEYSSLQIGMENRRKLLEHETTIQTNITFTHGDEKHTYKFTISAECVNVEK